MMARCANGRMSAHADIAGGLTDSHVVAAVAERRIRVLAFVLSPAATTPPASAVFNSFPVSNEVQRITVDATGGTYTITFSGQTTGNVAFDATAATVQSDLEALSNIAPGDVTVTGADGGPYTLTFGGAYADVDVPQVTCDSTNLTGGTHTATPSTTTAGPVGSAVSATFGLVAGVPVVAPSAGDQRSGWFETNVGDGLSVTTGAGAGNVGVHLVYEVVA